MSQRLIRCTVIYLRNLMINFITDLCYSIFILNLFVLILLQTQDDWVLAFFVCRPIICVRYITILIKFCTVLSVSRGVLPWDRPNHTVKLNSLVLSFPLRRVSNKSWVLRFQQMGFSTLLLPCAKNLKQNWAKQTIFCFLPSALWLTHLHHHRLQAYMLLPS